MEPNIEDDELKRLVWTALEGGTRGKLVALQKIASLERSHPELVKSLEQIIIWDRNQRIKEAAQVALKQPIHQNMQQQLVGDEALPVEEILGLIERWGREKLISSGSKQVLQQRYGRVDFDPIADATLVVPEERALVVPEEKKSFSLLEQILSETSINISLLLGAFFVIASAFIFATAVEELRIPILSILTISCFGAAFGLREKMALPSFSFFLIGNFVLPILGVTIVGQTAGWEYEHFEIGVGVVLLVSTLVSGIGATYYQSRFLVAASAIGLLVGVGFLFGSDTESMNLLLFIFTLGIAVGVAALIWWQKRFGSRFIEWGWGIFAFTLFFFHSMMFTAAIGMNEREEFLWGGLGLIIGAIIFVVADRFQFQFPFEDRIKVPFRAYLFPGLAVLWLLPVAGFLAGAATESIIIVGSVCFVWGGFLLLWGSGQWGMVKSSYEWSLMIGGGLLVLFASLYVWDEHSFLTVLYLGLSSVILGWLLREKEGAIVWAGCLFFAYLAYFSFWQQPAVEEWNVFPALWQLAPGLGMLGIVRFMKNRSPNWWWGVPTVGGGLILLSVMALSYDASTTGEEWISFVIWLLFAALGTLLAKEIKIHWFGIVTSFSLVNGLLFFMKAVGDEPNLTKALWIFLGEAIVFYLIGYWLDSRKEQDVWGKQNQIWYWSGLILATLVGFGGIVEDISWLALLLAIGATIYAVHAWQERNVWLAVPANFIYGMSYFAALDQLQIDEIQFYTVGAALLGLVMHYLFTRAGHKWAILLSGIIAQLILLGTTYIQMVDTDRLSFFLLLFIQGLILLFYGIVVRARTFVVLPICFVVLGVVTVAFDLLSGVPTVIVIGCTGSLFMLAGIVALWQRDRLLELPKAFGGRFADWGL